MSPYKSKNIVFVAASMVAAIVSVTSLPDQCEVLVHEPWPMPQLLVPNGSNLKINCTAAVGTDDPPFWAINLAADSSTTQFQFATRKGRLNAHGVYELPRIETPLTLRLLINDTAINNQTEIICDRGAQSITTDLYVFDLIPLTLNVLDAGVGSINLTWDLSVGDAAQIFLLTISHGSSSDIMSLNESYYHFTAPEGAPPCEVYNFSVTATYVGATYTGAGCSVPSPVLSTMLPSLPNISRLESSLNYVLGKQSTTFVIEVSFEPASYCENYPIVNYTLEVNSSLNREILASALEPNADRFTLGGNLSNENTLYTFRVVVTNNVGTILTSDRHVYTTDVQMVKVTLIEGVNASWTIIQCEFIPGSNATGCMVVLTGFVPYHVNLTRNPRTNLTTSESTVTLERPPSCYTGVEAFDIESDGSVGSLAVPGQLEGRSETPCAPIQTSSIEPKATEPLSILIVMIVVITIAVVVAVVIVLIVIIILFVRNCKSSQVGTRDAYSKFGCPASLCFSQSSADGDEHHQIQLRSLNQLTDKTMPDKDKECHAADVKADNAYSQLTGKPTKGYTSLVLAGGQGGAPSQEALYDLPTPAGGADNDRNDSSTANCEGTHATQDTHLYFTLEPGRDTGRVNSTPISPQIPSNISVPPQPANNECPPPIYQEITDLEIRGQAIASTVSGAGSIPNTSLPSSSPPLIQRPLSVPATDSDTQNPVG